jgi:hypothetical protein
MQVDTLPSKYPLLFSCQRNTIEVDDGWFNILDQLCSAMQSHINEVAHTRDYCMQWNLMLSEAHLGNWLPYEENYATSPPHLTADSRARMLDSSLRLIAEPMEQVTITCVKEKFGGLRIHLSGGDDYCYALIAMAERMSTVTCETCGNIGTLESNSGWLNTRCKVHRVKM